MKMLQQPEIYLSMIAYV